MQLNFLAITTAALTNIVLGAIWYSPKVLGTTWAHEHQLNPEECKPTVWHYVGALVISFITAWVLAMFIIQLNVVTLFQAVTTAFFIWLGFVATNHFSGVIWARKPFLAYIIDTAFLLVSLVIMACILALWR